MNKKALKTLEYNKIIEQLAAFSCSPSGRKLCEELVPSYDIEEIRPALNETSDAETRIFKKGTLSLSGIRDVRPSMKRLEIGSTLNILEILHVAALLETAGRAKAYAKKESAAEQEDCLDGLFAQLEPVSPLHREITRCILSEEEISDDASGALKQIRRSMKRTGEKIHTQLTSMVNGSARVYLQDTVITMRNNRYCLPVKAEYKGQVAGMIHDQSSTGSTFFVEPMAVVKLNNELRELEIKEQEEIEKILSTLSAEIGEHQSEILTDFEILTKLDFIFAKAQLSIHMKASKPELNTEGRIRLREARHPLLNVKKVVPITLSLGNDFSMLIVTGPNTGGKTVTLKTVGLLTCMAQAGLHIPALSRSEIAVFREVFADIGDEQSIEQSLSTFSSHMTNIVDILKHANNDCLVLFDELGAGTDPAEGAALSISILMHLHNQQIRTMATTHYSELKIFALSTPGVENASCEFDVESLSPTYRLLIGIPGKSNAFAISEKLGLQSAIIEDAKTRISQTDESLEDVLANLETSRKTIEKEELEISAYKTEIKELQKELEQKREKISSQQQRLIQEANEKAHEILREAKEYADQTMKDFQKFGKENISVKEMEAKRSTLRSKMSDREKQMAYKPKQKAVQKNRPEDFHIGDAVQVLSLNLKGTVSTLPNAKGDLFVQMGILRSQVNIRDLQLIDEPDITGPNIKRTSGGAIKMSKSAVVSPELNVIGRTVDEALAEMDKYLDDAYLAHIPQVRIVHGKGTGALRAAIHKQLRRTKHVNSFRLGTFGEGEAGVTIVEFK